MKNKSYHLKKYNKKSEGKDLRSEQLSLIVKTLHLESKISNNETWCLQKKTLAVKTLIPLHKSSYHSFRAIELVGNHNDPMVNGISSWNTKETFNTSIVSLTNFEDWLQRIPKKLHRSRSILISHHVLKYSQYAFLLTVRSIFCLKLINISSSEVLVL